MKIKIGLLFITVTMLTIINNAYAVNYVLGYSSVDDGEIRWGGSTTYSSQLSSAISTWNNYGDIDILPDNASTYEDLAISDVNYSDEDWYGQYDNDIFGTDELELNTANMGGLTSNQKQNIITHELGHALGLDHSIPNNIMVAVGELNRITLGTQDKADYDYLWN